MCNGDNNRLDAAAESDIRRRIAEGVYDRPLVIAETARRVARDMQLRGMLEVSNGETGNTDGGANPVPDRNLAAAPRSLRLRGDGRGSLITPVKSAWDYNALRDVVRDEYRATARLAAALWFLAGLLLGGLIVWAAQP